MNSLTQTQSKSQIEASNQFNLSKSLQNRHLSKFSDFLSLPLEIDSEIDFGSYFYTVRSGIKTLGIFTRQLNKDIYEARSFYHNPNNLKTQHKSEEEALAAIIGAYTGKTAFLKAPLTNSATYHLTLETIELDELGIPTERRVVVKKNPDLCIDWHLWAIEYSQLLGEPYRLSDVVRVDNSPLTEF